MTDASLEEAWTELYQHDMFRDATTGRRNGRIVKSFDIGLLRHDRTKAAAAAAPALRGQETTRDVMIRAQQEVLAANPHLNTVDGLNSDEFRRLRDGLITAWAKQSNPKLARGNGGAGPVLDGQGFPVYRS
jgi:hypothetical protein